MLKMSAVRKFYLWYVAQLHQVFRLKDVNNSISERGNLNCQTNCDNQKDVNNSTSKKCWWKRCEKHNFWGLRGVEMWHIITISLAIITVLIWYHHHRQFFTLLPKMCIFTLVGVKNTVFVNFFTERCKS